MQAIILAGGLGTRLRSAIGDFPKCMAPVSDRPFLDYLLRELAAQHVQRVVLSLGYRHEVVLDWLERNSYPMEIGYVIETEPLGTGGGIRLAMDRIREEQVLVLNGDTMFRVPLQELLDFHQSHQAATSLALKPMKHFDRYGVVVTDEAHRVRGFEEKKARASGLINGGVYCIDRTGFCSLALPERCSFEQDYLEAQKDQLPFYGFVSDAYFIDIGIPDDYRQAQKDFKTLFPA